MTLCRRFALALFAMLSASAIFAHTAPPLSTVMAVKELSAASLSNHPPVALQAVVTYYEPGTSLFVQDETAGIWVRPGTIDHGFRAGDLLRIEGVAGKGLRANFIESPAFTRLGRAPLPQPRRISQKELTDLSTDCDRVQFQGVIRSIAGERARLTYYIGVDNLRIPVTVDTLSRTQPLKLIGKTVTVTGVHGVSFNEWRQGRLGSRIYCPSPSDIVIEEGGEVSNHDIPLTRIADLADQQTGALVRIHALTDQFVSMKSIRVRDESGAILALTTQPGEIRTNTLVDLVGYVARTNNVVILDDAYFQRIGLGHTRTFKPGEKFPEPHRLIESAAEIRRLSLEEAERGHPVRLRGVITYYDPGWQLCFLQGSTEGIYIDTEGQPLDIASGQLIQLSGFTGPGDFAPVVRKPKFDILGGAPMPAPKMVPYQQLFTGAEDSQWLALEAIVRSVEDIGRAFEIEVAPTDSPESVTMVTVSKSSDPTLHQTDIVGAKVRIEAVCVTAFDSARRLKAISFLCPSFRYLTVLDRGKSDPFALPISSVNAAFQFSANDTAERRVHVLGVVSWTDRSGVFFLQDSTGGLKVYAPGATNRVGERLHVVGFRSMKDLTPSLERAVLREAGVSPEPPAVELDTTKAFAESTACEARLVTISGTLLENHRTARGLDLLLRDKNTTFAATLPGPVPKDLYELEPATLLQLTGVAVFEKDINLNPRALQVLVRHARDIHIVSTPPLWTARKLMGAVAIFALLCLVASLWIVVLRNRLALHKAELEAQMEIQRALEARVLQSQKMDSIGNLAGGVAHDFNNVLMVIMGYADLLRFETLSKKGRDSVDEVIRAARRAADLTRQLLVFSRKHTPERKALDLNQTVQGMTRMLERLLGEDIALRFDAGRAPMIIDADKGMIEQVIMNLAVNAADAMPNGGTLLISTARTKIDAPHNDSPPGDYIRVTVTDTGVGIPKENLSKIFEPFFTTKEVGKGTGLGLATVYGIVNQHNGWIDVKSEPGQGATFEIHFPATAEVAAQTSEPSNQSAPAPGAAKILLVEDEEQLRRLVAQVLTGAGYEVIQADCGPAALKLAREHGDIDLLISDVIMPGGMTGAQVVEQLKMERPDLPIILTSGYSEFRGRTLRVPEGAAFLQKPYSPQTLLARAAELLATRPEALAN